jgi:pilus assembly protein CpaB
MTLATLASYGVYRTIQQMPVKQVQVVERLQVVATKPVAVGIILTPEMVKTVPWPAAFAMPGGFVSPADVLGRGVTAALVENEPVIESKLAPRGAGGGMVTTIPSGMRAMSVRVNDVSGVAGFAVPGTRVDVVVTARNERETISRTVLSNIQVLTAGTKYDVDKSRDGTPIPTAVVTLLVTPPDAERLALATTQGQIALSLRNPLDTAATESAGARMANLTGGPSPAPVMTNTGGRPRAVPVAAPPPPPPTTSEVLVTTGKDTKKVTIPKGGGGF